MKAIELKFLLKLLSKPDYISSLGHLRPNESTKGLQKDKICRDLRDRELVACTEEITKIKATPSGKALMKLGLDDLPLSELELQILEAAQLNAITPSKTKVTPAKKRQELIYKLIDQGLIAPTKTQLRTVQLTDKGKEFLANYDPNEGGNVVISQRMLGNYLRFVRQYFSRYPERLPQVVSESQDSTEEPPHTLLEDGSKIYDSEVLETILDLDEELETENYLPIFYLRKELQPPLSRDELDQALYRLESLEKIELSALSEVEEESYSDEELEAGIPQPTDGVMFFITVN